jgi:hypothetical protein
MASPVAARTAAGRSWRPGRVVAVIGGVLALLVAGSLAALRFHGAPQATGTAAGSTSPPTASGSVPSRPASAATSRSASTPASVPARSPSAYREATPTARATASATAATKPPLVKVPNVVGMTFTKARLVLTEHGFKVVGRHPRLGQTVTSTSPSGRAPAGSVIIVVYGTGV